MTTRRRKGNSPNSCMAALSGSIARSSLIGSFGSFHAWMHARAPRFNMQSQYSYFFGKSRKHRSRKKSTIREMLTATGRTLLCPIVCTLTLQDLRYFFLSRKIGQIIGKKQQSNPDAIYVHPYPQPRSGQLSQITNEEGLVKELRLCFASTKNIRRVPHFLAHQTY